MHDIIIGKNTIGFNQPLYFVADIGANHDGDLDRAFKLIELANEAGAHAAKFQNFQASKIVSRSGLTIWVLNYHISQIGKNRSMELTMMQAFLMTGQKS